MYMTVTVKTTNDEFYTIKANSITFYKGKLIVIDKDGNTQTYSEKSLASAEPSRFSDGMITIS